MNHPISSLSIVDQARRMERYYRLHSKIYDATRWSFLFGRKTIIQRISASKQPANILEIGCGTGKNLINLGRAFPQAQLSGLDISASMLKVAQQNLSSLAGRVNLWQTAYDRPLQPERPYDLILFSYSLSMMNPDWNRALNYAEADLAPGGLIAVVDFYDSTWSFFKRWMGINHVRMDGHLLPGLESCFQTQTRELHQAYAGFWTYFLFIGEKKFASLVC